MKATFLVFGLLLVTGAISAQVSVNPSRNLKISGFGLGAASFSPSAGKTSPVDYLDLLDEQERDGVFVRVNVLYDTPEGGFKGRWEFDPTLSASSPTQVFSLKYAQAFVKLFHQLRIDAGSLRDTAFAFRSLMTKNYNSAFFVGALSSGIFPERPNQGFGYEAGLWAPTGGFISGITGVEVKWQPAFMPRLVVAVMAPEQTSSSMTAKATDFQTWASGLDYLASYHQPGFGTLKLGYMGAATRQTWSDFFGTFEFTGASHFGLLTSVGAEALAVNQAPTDGKSHTSINGFATGVFDFRLLGWRDLAVSEDLGFFTSGTTFTTAVLPVAASGTYEDKPAVSTSTRLQFTFENWAPALNMIPGVTYRFFNYEGTINTWASGVELGLKFTTGSAVLALGAGWYSDKLTPQESSFAVMTVGTLFAW
ncbi:MAG: hypothetical protein HKM05_03785 [Spirochaetales bacterium]|nr:hypothetical protein [Spirochaetales bacterium]